MQNEPINTATRCGWHKIYFPAEGELIMSEGSRPFSDGLCSRCAAIWQGEIDVQKVAALARCACTELRCECSEEAKPGQWTCHGCANNNHYNYMDDPDRNP